MKKGQASTVLLSILVFISICEGKVFSRCGFHDELIKREFQRTFIPHWACLVDSESGRNTTKIGVGPVGSKKFGIFQINSKDWCKIGKKGGKCNIKCEDLLDDDITNDVACAKFIHKIEGFKAWSRWTQLCKKRDLTTYVAHCPALLIRPSPSPEQQRRYFQTLGRPNSPKWH